MSAGCNTASNSVDVLLFIYRLLISSEHAACSLGFPSLGAEVRLQPPPARPLLQTPGLGSQSSGAACAEASRCVCTRESPLACGFVPLQTFWV